VPAQLEPVCFNVLVEVCGQHPFVRQVLEGAFEVGPDLSYIPNLISRFNLTTKPFTLTYHIRPEARWSDNVPVTAHDFRFTWQTYKKLGLSDFPTAIRQVRALNKKTVRIDFRSPFASWRDLFGVVLPWHALAGEDPTKIWKDTIDNPKTGNPIGSGPFLVGPVEPGRQITLVRNPHYWGPHESYLDGIVFRFFAPPFPGSLLEALRGGSVNLIVETAHEAELAAFCREPGARCLTAFQTGWEFIAFRTRGPGGHDALKLRSVRQAIAYGIDREALVRQLYPDLASLQALQNFIFAPGQRFYEPHWKAYTYQPAKARQLLEKAGCHRSAADGIYVCFGERLSFELVTTPLPQVRARTSKLVQAQLRQAGVEVVGSYVPRGELFDKVIPTGNYDLALYQATTGPDPGSSADIWRCGGQYNWTGYCSALVTHEFARSQFIVDNAQRARALNSADRQLAKDVPALPLFQDPSTTAFKGSRLRGLVPNGSLERILWNSEDWWIER
jgi:peptide/nickel transport system substrate-binding protein